MRDEGNLIEDGRVEGGYVDFALEVIRRLAKLRSSGVEGLHEALVIKLFDLVKSAETPDMDEVMQGFRSAKVSAESIVIDYIPEVARRLGTAWEQDTLSFSVVTTGLVKLQNLLHRAARDCRADGSDEDSDRTILLVVPMGEQHTLGAMSAAAWLRMKGVSVCLKIGPGSKELSQILKSQHFDGVFVSIGSESKTDVCAKLVKTLRTLSKGALPLVLGGPLALKKRNDLVVIGADTITTDLSEALAFVGINHRDKRRYTG
jgi:methylmalonyl-CoA mutase cobalamin-binding subunit